tara:strand:+ start:3425 stop:4027 length:603 start_codon:yes stop_codon:yes gene_type:complete
MVHLQKLGDNMSDNFDDIQRVLAICFRTGQEQTIDDLERILSFDMGWMDTETAHNAIKALIYSGWISDDKGVLSPNCEIKGIVAPLGWQPRPSRLLNPVVFNANDLDVSDEKESDLKSSANNIETVTIIAKENLDPRARVEKRLVKYISKQTNIPPAEIIRRGERKMKALRYCTMWLSLCLISREQGLEMNSIIDSFTGN